MDPIKLRAEIFWADRWLSSSAAMLPLEARGLYREMLTTAWALNASLPADIEAIKRAIRCTDDEWQRSWPIVRRYWHERDGRLINDVQVEVFRKTEQSRERSRTAAQSRWDRQLKATLKTDTHAKTHRDTHSNTHRKTNGNTQRHTHRSPHMRSGSGSGSGSGVTTTKTRTREKKTPPAVENSSPRRRKT